MARGIDIDSTIRQTPKLVLSQVSWCLENNVRQIKTWIDLSPAKSAKVCPELLEHFIRVTIHTYIPPSPRAKNAPYTPAQARPRH